MATDTPLENLAADREAIPRSTGRLRRFGLGFVLVASLLVVVVGATTVTGFPGPGPFRRYPTADLDRLASKINSSYPGCDLLGSPPLAFVDNLRSRVILRAGWTRMRTNQALDLGPTEQAMIEEPPADTSSYVVICGGPG